MKRLILYLSLGLSFFAPTEAQAHMGWTLGQCREYYRGETAETIDKSGDSKYAFADAGPNLSVTVTLKDGKVVNVSYEHKPVFNQFRGLPGKVKDSDYGFSKKEIKDLLFENSMGCIWSEVGSDKRAIYYSGHLDGRVLIEAMYGKGALSIWSGWEP
jgi:hypothetical protein